MLKMVGTACIETSPEKVWQVLANLENLPQWSEVVLSASCDGSEKQGVGTQRTCVLKNNVTIFERWTDWQEGKSYTYEGFNLPMVKSAKNTWTVVPDGEKTLLKTESEVVLKGGLLGRLLEPLMRLMANRMGANALAAFKYLAENGESFNGKHSRLPRVATVC